MNTPDAPKGQVIPIFIKSFVFKVLLNFRMVAPIYPLSYGPALPEAGGLGV